MLAGKYTLDSVFTDTVRARWNKDGDARAEFEEKIGQVEKLKTALEPGDAMVTAALRYVISHPVAPVAIPGSKSPEQAVMNAAAGEKALSAIESKQLTDLL